MPFQPKYYALKVAHDPLSKTENTQVLIAEPEPVEQKVNCTELSDACAAILEGTWGGFGSYALFDNGKIHIIVRFVRTNCYDIKIRLSGHLVYSSVSRTDLDTTLGQVRSYLKGLRDNIVDVVG